MTEAHVRRLSAGPVSASDHVLDQLHKLQIVNTAGSAGVITTAAGDRMTTAVVGKHKDGATHNSSSADSALLQVTTNKKI